MKQKKKSDVAVLMDYAGSVTRYGWMAFAAAGGGNALYFAGLMCTHLAAFRTAANIRKRGAARAANCEEFIRRLPKGYDTPIGENGTKLSGGERQRISIARALLKDASIVFLDEATASLDVENETKVQGALSRLLAGKTVLVIAHRMRTVAGADHIVVLENGRVAEEGTPAELMEKGRLYRRMTELQQKSAGWSLG